MFIAIMKSAQDQRRNILRYRMPPESDRFKHNGINPENLLVEILVWWCKHVRCAVHPFVSKYIKQQHFMYIVQHIKRTH